MRVGSAYGDDPEDSIESVSLGTATLSGGRSSSTSLLAKVLGSLVGLASVGKLVTHKLGDNVDVLGRLLLEVF